MRRFLKECGIDKFPGNLEEFNEAIVKIKKKGYTPISLGNVANWPAESCIFSLLMSRVCGKHGFRIFIKNMMVQLILKTGFIEALNIMKNGVELGAFNSDVNSNIDYTESSIF